MTNVWGKLLLKFFKYAPSCVVCLSFLPCGLIFGYTICSLVAERNLQTGLIYYGPLILGACWALVTALTMLTIKYVKKCIVYWQAWLLLAAGVLNLVASCFYFADGFDHVGAYISYLAHSMTFIAGYSFLHTISSKSSRSLMMSASCSCYLLGIATAVSLIGSAYSRNLKAFAGQTATTEQLIDGIYVNFAGTYLSIAAATLAILVGIKVLHFVGTVDLVNSMDNDLRIANGNGSIFEPRSEVIKQLQFFYVTKNQQWNVMLLLLFTEAIQFALFVYFIYWFALNPAIRLTQLADIDAMFWVIFGGSCLTLICLFFISVKVNFVASQMTLVFFTLLAMIICSSTDSRWSLWVLLVLFGMSYSSLQIALLEVTNLRFTECIISISYILKLICTSIVYYYFVADTKNSYFYATDKSTLMAQGFVFMIISSLLALVVGMKVPRTHRTKLMDIQYEVYGIIFMKHQIEQLNVKWLNDGTIPTISQ
ncbi:uncharacterized protein LOC108157237 [Drosophila miranda]|uniref:uncharacterized protein LOC108157237 n=1 Tax=Drosophila miranda TaxID=7229 RepID=UPI0007E7BA0A|nr:uncharacterized protein LOC108157237 [Drosophila miranda]XP_017144701.1 uncharacterized protein LOC108157237 [Drosophila miranda]